MVEAKKSYEEALRIAPTLAVAWNNLACILLEEGDPTTALQNFSKAIYFDPSLECAYTNIMHVIGPEQQANQLTHIACTLRDSQRESQAEYVYRRSLAVFETAQAYSGLGIIYHRAHKLQEAVALYTAALRINPILQECHTNIGLALRDLGDLNGARLAFMNVMRLSPTSDDHNNLACICKDLGLISEAIEHYQSSFRVDSTNMNVFCNLIHSYQMVCDWRDYDSRMKHLVAVVEQQLSTGQFPSVHPHHTFLYPLSNKTRRNIATAHAKAASDFAALTHKPAYDHSRAFPIPPGGRIRVGYVSSDYKDHPTAHLMQSLPGFHDRSRVEVFLYSLAADDGSSYRKKLEAEAEHFVDFSSLSFLHYL